MIKNYFKTAIRTLIKNKAFSLINILGLAVSMTVCLLIINIIAEQKRYDAFHTKKDRIFRVMTAGVGSNQFETATSASPLAKKLKEEYTGIEQAATLVRSIGGDMLYNDNAASGGGYFADENLFKIFDFKLSKGDIATALRNPFSLVITEDIAKQLFGTQEPIGKVVQFNDKGISPGGPEKGNRETAYGNFAITGVLQALPGKTHLPFKLLASLNTLPILAADKKVGVNINDWNDVWTNYTYLLLDKTKTEADLQNMLNQISAKQYKKGAGNEYQFKAKALAAIALSDPIGNETSITMPYTLLVILGVLGLIVMLSACLNYTNLSVARSLSRTKEVGIRKVSGATRTQIFLQFIVEAIIVSLLSLLLAIVFLYLIKGVFTSLWFNQFLNITLEQSGWLYLIFVAFSIVIGLIAGLLPSIYISAFNPLVMMRNFGGIKYFKRLTLRKVLLVVQFSVSLIFIISTVVLYQQTNHILNFNYGFNKENVINVSLYKQENYQRFVQAISSNKNIAAVSGCSFLPSTGTQHGTLVRKAENKKDSLQINFLDADSKFLDVLGLQLIAGKTFPDVYDTTGERYVIVNETFVKDFKYTSPAGVIGQRIEIDGRTVEIIGVLKDFQFVDVTQSMRPLVLRNRPAAYGFASIKVAGTDMPSVIDFLQSSWKKVNPSTKFEYQFYDEQLLFVHSMLNSLATIFGSLSFLAVFISCLGLLGMATYTAETRAKEISIRKVVGSSVSQIIVLLTKGFVKLLLIATLIAIPLAYLINNMWLQFFASRVSVTVLTLMISVLAMLLISLLTVFSQSWRAAFANPIKSLRTE